MNNELILYQTEDGHSQVQLRTADGSAWLAQMEVAELFSTTKQNVSLHIRNILADGELVEDSVVKESLTTAAEVQNKLLFAVTKKTAAEIVVGRADPDNPNMALTTWSGSRVRKQDVIVAKNYLTQDEVDTLNRLVVIFLEQAELRTKEHKELTLSYWRQNVNRLLEFNERPVLEHAGKISADEMKQIVHERYHVFDTHRRRAEAQAADLAQQASELARRAAYGEAMALLDRAASLAPAYVVVYQYQANVAFLMGDYNKAEAALERAIELEPDNALFRRNLADVRKKQGQP